MRAYVTSIGEPTTQLCCDMLHHLGFSVVLISSSTTTLAEKLKYIYNHATEDFIRVDADVIPTESVKDALKPTHALWTQYTTFDMYNFQLGFGGVQRISKELLTALRNQIVNYMHDDRPETRMWRLEEFQNRTHFVSSPILVGIHGFGQKDWERVKKVKDGRKHDDYDWWLVERMQEFYR